jgi:plasmid stabilization system protein ParE
MAKAVRVSGPALRWIEQEAERIAGTFGASAAEEFRDRIKAAVEAVAAFPNMTKRGTIPGTRTITVHKRTVLTIVERDGGLVVAAARNHWQGDALAPREALSAADDGLREAPAESGPKG